LKLENSEERKQFLKERLMLLRTALPAYTNAEEYKLRLVKKEITYLENELKLNTYLSFNHLL